MERKFGQTIALLRKERKLSQKEAAEQLGVSQALLSHYEKGIRECGLDFVVKAADFYDVSCDYLLGKTAERNFSELTETVPERGRQNTPVMINRRLINNSLNVIYDNLAKLSNRKLTRVVTIYFMLDCYKVFRLLSQGNPSNPQEMFTIPEQVYLGYSEVAQKKIITDIECAILAEGETRIPQLENLELSPEKLADEYPEAAGSLFNVIQQAETSLHKVKS